MKKHINLKLNSKGFGHIELLLMVVFIVAFAGTAFLIHDHNKNKNITHAATYVFQNYTYLGSAPYNPNPKVGPPVGPVISFYACLLTVGSVQRGFAYTVEGYALSSSQMNISEGVVLDDWAGTYGPDRWDVIGNTWVNGVWTKASHLEDITLTNLIAMYPLTNPNQITTRIHSRSLAACYN